MMKTYINKEIDDINFNESGILSLKWVNEERDISLNIDWCGQNELAATYNFNSIETSLLFEFVTDLEINFKFLNGNMGGLEITKFNYSQNGDIWEILFEFSFQPKGYMKFRCNNLKFIIDDSR